jgi:predicted transcriptional regulator
MMRRGTLSRKTKQMIMDSPEGHVGADFGKFCMEMGYTIREVAEAFKVTKPTVYSWFRGEFEPRSEVADKMRSLMKKLRNAPVSETPTKDE